MLSATYIVDYIVENTVGELLSKCKKPNDALKLKILDPACGSGSFLLGAFGRLIDWFEDYYNAHPEKISKAPKAECWHDKEHADGPRWRLTARYKGKILSNCIYGVDIDPQAVEVTIMSLYLRVLESVNVGLLMKTALLPPLEGNVKCGNSLIGSDYWDFVRESQGELFERGEAEERRVNTFDWDVEFPDIVRYAPGGRELAQGYGFDAVIGNPPYLFITEQDKQSKLYYDYIYGTYSYRYDLYGLFIEKIFRNLIMERGQFGFIIPHTILNNDSFELLRGFMLEKTVIRKLIDLGPGVFENARNETMLIFAEKAPPSDKDICLLIKSNNKLENLSEEESINQGSFNELHKKAFLIIDKDSLSLLKKVKNGKQKLGGLCTINQGLRTGNNEKYLSDIKTLETHKKAVGGKHIGRYNVKSFVFVQYEPKKLDAPRRESIFLSERKLIVQEIRNITLPRRIVATFDDSQLYCLQSTNVINLKNQSDERFDIKYLLALINSSLLNWFFRNSFPSNNHIASNQLAELPIPSTNSSDAEDISKHDRMVTLVDGILDLHKRLAAAKSDSDKTRLERAIKTADAKIDCLVYDLYGLTDEEIKVVEGG